jgi:hypothetical protein
MHDLSNNGIIVTSFVKYLVNNRLAAVCNHFISYL